MSETDPFVFPEELEAAIVALRDHYPDPHAVVIPALHHVQDAYGHLSDESLVRLGDLLDVPAAEIFGTLTFYTMFRRRPEGRFHINVCKNLTCHLTGSNELRSHIESKLGIAAGETSADGIFTLGEVECLGACTESPVLEVDGEYHFRVTPQKADEILDDYRRRAGSAPEAADDSAGADRAEPSDRSE